MIRLERPAAAPPYFASSEVERFRTGVRDFFSRAEKTRRQERCDFPLFPRHSYALVLQALSALSHEKCAYCESPLSVGPALDRFRPKAGAVGLSGDFSTEHYWWLAYAWENIYPCCLKCNKFKGAKFPVEGRRCLPDADAQELAAERRLLVDPFSDQPHEHLDFLDNGTVVPQSSTGDVTIHKLELIRSDLVLARERVAKGVSGQLEHVRLASNLVEEAGSWLHRVFTSGSSVEDKPTALRRVASALDAGQPYAAVARAVMRRWMEAVSSKSAAGPAKAAQAAKAAPVAQEPEPPHAYVMTAKDRTVAKKAQGLRRRIVTRVAVHNFRGIRDLELAIDYERGFGAPWTVLLGEKVVRGKGNNFPLARGSKRATAPGQEKGEKPLLLNPEIDDPQQHVEFGVERDRAGVIRAALIDGKPSPKGVASIDLYPLDWPQLTRARADFALRLLAHLRNTRRTLADHLAKPNDADLKKRYDEKASELGKFLDPRQPYCAMARQIARAELPGLKIPSLGEKA
jgi:hypothetical protein